MVPHLLIQKYLKILGYSAFSFLMVLFHFANRYGDKFHVTDEKLEQDFGMSKSTIKKSRKRLKQLGFIDSKRGFKLKKISRATIYTILPKQELREELRIRDRQKRTDIDEQATDQKDLINKIANS